MRLASKLLLAAAVVFTSTGCGTNFAITTPAGFAELEDQDDYGYRATSPEGVVLAVRREDNAPYGDLSFWSGALDAHLRRAGYAAVAVDGVWNVEVESADGVIGSQSRYTRVHEGREHAFCVTVFVTDDQVITVETGGDSEFFGDRRESLDKAISSLVIG